MILPESFTMDQYGLHARLVVESDAELIIELRKQDTARFMSSVGEDVEQQKAWIRAYKLREREGIDYYFLYERNGEPLGLNRTYHIQKDSFVGGSFVFKTGCDFETPIFATLMQFDLGFNTLDKSVSFGNIRKDNKKALKFNLLMGSDLIYEDESEYFVLLTKKQFNSYKTKMESILQNG